MTIDEMKKIAALKSKDIWYCHRSKRGTTLSFGPDVFQAADFMPLKDIDQTSNDMEFMAMAANNWDKIMAVADAVKEFADAYIIEENDVTQRVLKALKALEKE